MAELKGEAFERQGRSQQVASKALETVDGDGTGALSATDVFDEVSETRVYVPLAKFRTISIRDTTINDGIGPEAMVACGHVATHPGG